MNDNALVLVKIKRYKEMHVTGGARVVSNAMNINTDNFRQQELLGCLHKKSAALVTLLC